MYYAYTSVHISLILQAFAMIRALRLNVLAFVAAIALLAVSSMAHAQVPPSAQPGIVTRSLEQQDRNRGKIEGAIVQPEKGEAAPSGSTKKVFKLTDVIVDGSTVYDQEDFSSVIDEYKGEQVSFADLNRIAAALTRKYRDDGYVFSRVVMSPQKLKDGVVHMRAIEGRVAKVEVRGNVKDANGLIEEMAAKIRSAGPTNTHDIERYLLLIDDLPGVTARSFVKPSRTQGAGDLVIVVEEKPVEGAVTFGNRSSRYVGQWRGEVVGAFNSLFGIHDRTTVRGIVTTQTKELRYGEITHEEQLFAEGLRVKGRYAVTSTEPGGTLSPLGIQGDSNLFDLEALYPVVRGRNMNLTLSGGFAANDTSTDLSGFQIAEDRVRSVRLKTTIDAVDGLSGINQLDVGVTKGLKGFNATGDGIGRTRANGKQDFVRYNATASRVQDLFIPGVSAMVSATGQYAPDPLLASEEFTLGGDDFGRAYDAGELAGDRGYAGSLELRYGGDGSGEWLESYQFYGFIDYGKVKNLKPVVGEVANDSLTSAGGGVRYNLAHALSGYLEVAKPLNKIVVAEGDEGTRVFVKLTKRF